MTRERLQQGGFCLAWQFVNFSHRCYSERRGRIRPEAAGRLGHPLGNEMNPYSSMLAKAAEEIHQFRQNEYQEVVDDTWLESLMSRLRRASSVSGTESVERELDIISRMIVDSGPLMENFSPSLYAALDAVQRGRKRSQRRN
jgi:hypothetical protein